MFGELLIHFFSEKKGWIKKILQKSQIFETTKTKSFCQPRSKTSFFAAEIENQNEILILTLQMKMLGF
jgi:hypothetical protein